MASSCIAFFEVGTLSFRPYIYCHNACASVGSGRPFASHIHSSSSCVPLTVCEKTAAVGTGCMKWKRHSPIHTKVRSQQAPTGTGPTGTVRPPKGLFEIISVPYCATCQCLGVEHSHLHEIGRSRHESAHSPRDGAGRDVLLSYDDAIWM